MATEEAKVVDSVPPPPAYFKLFSPDVAAETSDATEGRAPAANGFPLAPPPPPGPGETYKMFGMPYSSEPVEEELLPPEKMLVPASIRSIDFRVELKRLLDSIMANYGQFMEMLISSPSHAHKKLSDVETLFVNFHSLLNRYRAHQARHLVLERLRGQAAENDAVMSALEAAMEKCASARKDATARLGHVMGSGGDQAKADGVDPMDVVDERTVEAGKGNGAVGTGSEGAAANGSAGVVEKGNGGTRRDELRAAPVGEHGR
eukprot:g1257.t1